MEKNDRCPWCGAKVQCDRRYGRGYVPRWILPRIEWTCGSGQLSDDDEPTQSKKCIEIIFREVGELRGEVQIVTKQRDNLLRHLSAEFKANHPIVIEPDWLVITDS